MKAIEFGVPTAKGDNLALLLCVITGINALVALIVVVSTLVGTPPAT